jgi:hypothetical protein
VDYATFWAIFSLPHLVTLVASTFHWISPTTVLLIGPKTFLLFGATTFHWIGPATFHAFFQRSNELMSDVAASPDKK